VWLLGQSTDWTDFAQFGAVGLFLALFVAGVVVRGKQLEKAEERAERAENREREMRDKLEDRVLPLLVEVARELAESNRRRTR
jgi:hypothetical protein